jgi:hypothetical protein
VLDAAPSNLDAIAVEERHSQIRTLEPIVVASVAESRLRQREGDDQHHHSDVQTLAGRVDREFYETREAEPVGEGAYRLHRPDRSSLSIVQRRIDERVEREQQARRRLADSGLSSPC